MSVCDGIERIFCSNFDQLHVQPFSNAVESNVCSIKSSFELHVIQCKQYNTTAIIVCNILTAILNVCNSTYVIQRHRHSSVCNSTYVIQRM